MASTGSSASVPRSTCPPTSGSRRTGSRRCLPARSPTARCRNTFEVARSAPISRWRVLSRRSSTPRPSIWQSGPRRPMASPSFSICRWQPRTRRSCRIKSSSAARSRQNMAISWRRSMPMSAGCSMCSSAQASPPTRWWSSQPTTVFHQPPIYRHFMLSATIQAPACAALRQISTKVGIACRWSCVGQGRRRRGADRSGSSAMPICWQPAPICLLPRSPEIQLRTASACSRCSGAKPRAPASRASCILRRDGLRSGRDAGSFFSGPARGAGARLRRHLACGSRPQRPT